MGPSFHAWSAYPSAGAAVPDCRSRHGGPRRGVPIPMTVRDPCRLPARPPSKRAACGASTRSSRPTSSPSSASTSMSRPASSSACSGPTAPARRRSSRSSPRSSSRREGTARIFGFDVSRDEKKIRRIMNMVAGGEQSGYGILTVREQLWMFSQFYGLPRKEGWRRVDELIDAVGMGDERLQRVSTLSTGQRQKMNIARGLLNDPWILFLDEPTLGLDVAAARQVRELVVAWKQAVPGRTVLLTTHYMAEADELCDRIAIVDHGKILAIGTPDELKKRVQRESIFRLELDRLAGRPGRPGGPARCRLGGQRGRRRRPGRSADRGRQPGPRRRRRPGRGRRGAGRPGLADPGPAEVGAEPRGRLRRARRSWLRRGRGRTERHRPAAGRRSAATIGAATTSTPPATTPKPPRWPEPCRSTSSATRPARRRPRTGPRASSC